MCSIRDLVDIRSVNPPIHIWTVNRKYSLTKEDDGRLFATYHGEPTQGKSISYNTNEIFIDALEAGENIQNGSCIEDIATKWIEKYGFTPHVRDSMIISGSTPNGIVNCLTLIYMKFCMFLKAKYGYDLFRNSEIEKTSVSECADKFFLDIQNSKIISFEGCNIKIKQDDCSLYLALSSMLGDYVTTDNGWQQFVCKTCGKTSLRRNPKKCYCNECSGKRYQVSRQKKRMEGR